MEVGHIVRFSSQEFPFLVETTPCLDLDCSCSMMGLTLRELSPSGSPASDRLTFTLRVCLKTWAEHDPPPRSLDVESLAREFMARFPNQRIQELGQEFAEARAIKGRLASLSLSGSPDELVAYSGVIREKGGMREGFSDESFFFVLEGREFLIEDHYCANPPCDCQEVHLEFWERVREFFPERRVKIQQCLMVTLSLEGKLNETRYSNETTSTTRYLLAAWRRRCGDQRKELRRRYELIKAIGRRSFPRQSKTSMRVDTGKASGSKQQPPPQIKPRRGTARIRRNDRCPCGSGLKFKRCCAGRFAVGD